MDLSHEEQLLLGDFRRLGASERREMLDYARFLAEKQQGTHREQEAGDRCGLAQREQRPEAAKEPIVTE